MLLCAFQSWAQPANDLCSGALPINPNNGCVSGTTVGADDSWVGAVGCQGGGTNVDVWYTFTAINGQLNYDVTTSGAWAGNVEFILVEATGSCTGLGIAGSDCGPSVLSGTVNGLQSGTLYYITISTPSGGTPGDFTLCIDNVAPPIIPGQDCSSAAILCDDAAFSQTNSSAGFGTQEITTGNSCWGSGGERQSKWFKFTIGCDGTLEFNINPNVSSDDYDWALFDVTSGTCPSTASTTPSAVACNWSGCKGSTGISTCVDIATDEPGTVTSGSGCQGGPAAWETTVINATAGQTYALLVDNFSASNSGFTLTFGGACGGGTALLGPDAGFTYTNTSCGVYDFSKTCQTTNSTFLWTFGDGTTSTLQNPSHTYTSTGTFTVVLEVTDALGCTRTASETFTVNFPVATATPNPDAICSGSTTSIALSSTVGGTTYSWVATDNANVTGESLTAQTATTIANTLVNTSPTPQVVTYTVTPTAAGCVGADLTVQVTVNPIPVISGNAPICVGETLQLSASGTPNATTPWTSSNTAVATVDNSGLVTSVSAGSTTITYTDDVGCQQTVVVTVNAVPTISGNAPICIGSTLQLTGSGTPDATTPWTSSIPGVATVDNTGLVTAVGAGTTTITYLEASGCENTVTVTVNTGATISGNAPICEGVTLQLTGSGTPDATTPWTSSNTGVATVDNTGLVTSVSAGSTTITYLDANGCQATVVVTVDPTPTISGNAPVCVGSTLQLTGSGTPSAVTPWSSSNTGAATIGSTGLLTGVGAGTTTITYTNDAGCQNTVVVTVNAAPVISTSQTPLSGCNAGDGAIQVSDAGGATGTVNWTGTASGTSGVVTLPYNITTLDAGTYDVTFTSSTTGCTSNTSQEILANPGAPIVDPIADTISCGVSFTLLNADISGTLTGNQAYYTAAGGPSGSGSLIPDGTVYSAPTNVVIYAYDENGACASEVFFNVVVNSIPTISGDTPICVGSTVQLTGSGTPDGTTPWSTSDAGVATVSATGLVTGVSAGTATITYMDNNGCQNTTTITVNALPTISGNAPICGTGTVQLTGSGTPNASTPWTSSNTGVATVSNTGLVTGVAAGTTTITYTNNNGCQATETVTVNALPTISGNAPICVGDNLQLTGSGIPDGTTPWTTSDAGIASISNTGLVTGVSAGTATITYLDDNGCQNTVSVTVNAIPTISGGTTLCSGSTSTLTGSGTPNATNPWTSSNTTVATVDAGGVVTAISAGSTIITYTNSAGCSTTTTVTVNNVPTVSGSTDICGTSTITLTGSGTQNATTPWTSSDTGVATVDNAGNVTGVAAGSTTITYTDVNGCQATQNVSVYANPTISGATSICAGATLQLTGSGTPNASSPWTSSNPGVASVDGSGLVTTAAPGSVTITYVDANGCQTTESITVLASPVINPVTDQTVCDVFILPAISGTDLTANVSYWTGAGGTGTQLSQGDQITTTSTIFIYDQNGSCISEESFIVTINPAPVLDVVADTTVCGSFNLPTISGQNLTGSEAYYNDSQANGGTVITGTLTTSQTIWIYDGSGTCSDETSFNLTVNSLPTATISGGGVYCEGDAIGNVVVDVTGTPDWTINYTLNGTPQVATGSSSPITLGNGEGDYVLIDVTDAGCSSTASGTETISITPTPNAPSVSGGAEYCSTESLNDLMASGGNGTFTWYSDATLSTVIGNGDMLTPNNTTGATTYYVTETVNGCEGPSSNIVVTVFECAISVPTAFTPNGDNAHDTWELVNLDEAYPNNVVRVFNRWGNILFESAPGNYNANVWDGSHKGEMLPVGSYYYIIELNNDEQETMTGTVTIVLE